MDISTAGPNIHAELRKNVLNPPDGTDGTPFELCAATREDWSRYVESENQALRSRWMAWWDDKVFIVEVASALHNVLVNGVRRAIYGSNRDW
ncbi:hypothetical protein PsorP6_014227 [Peronosclerospora sorghi]|uniref:Uncharacterized protein n=1 Tax=Peronosclerospora sorghi TaxID=230839 RepID=A0ACC0VGK4_9STRA|nr:hypothetical protein PsorP6_014227 [Peronosclerospora sorghi]